MSSKTDVFSKTLIGVILGVSILALYGFLVEPQWIEIRHVNIENHGTWGSLVGKVAVHLSDLHLSRLGRREERALAILDDLKPDFVFLTGDYVSWDGSYDAALAFLSKVKAKVGVWAVAGDYDYSRSRRSCLFCHRKGSGKPTGQHQVRFLRNAVEEVKLAGESVFIGGVDREALAPFTDKGNTFSENVRGPLILLSHSPLEFDCLGQDQDVLVIAGDTHGGQVPLPSWLWTLLGYGKNARYNQGLFEEGKKKMYVSRGIGTSHVPFRFLRRPEVVVIHFGRPPTADG